MNMVEVLVEHDYIAKELDELTIKKGDIIKNVVKRDGGWWEGVLNEKKGLFPDNFVKILNSEVNIGPKEQFDFSKTKFCQVLFNYEQEHKDELNLTVGDIITILGEEEEGWWRGLLNGKEGVFPSNFVELIPSNKIHSTDNVIENGITCIVKYAYTAQNDDELTLKEGDKLTIISKNLPDSGWWKGELNGKVGVFPDNFVEIINENHVTKLLGNCKTSSSVASERKSLQLKIEKPLPCKKPLPVKKYSIPSVNNSKQLVLDSVDGPSTSKLVAKSNELHIFDQVGRRSLLRDVRANRAKPPGRRPTSISNLQQFRSNDYDIDPSQVCNSQNEDISVQLKPKTREWVKNKAPWLEEMKEHQSKRVSPSPSEDNNLTLIISENEGNKKSSKCILEKKNERKSDKENMHSNFVKTEINHQSVNSFSNKLQEDTSLRNCNAVSNKDYLQLIERIRKLELQIEDRDALHAKAIEELQGKLNLEIEMRIMLQEKVEEMMQCIKQV